MKAQILRQPASIEANPLHLQDVPQPVLRPGHILIKVSVCGVCHTDLHLVEGELPNPKLPIIPGHEVVGQVVENGDHTSRFQVGDRVGVPWLHESCQGCAYCEMGRENLCDDADFTGYTVNGGYAEYITVPEAYAVPIPDHFADEESAPLLCAGIVGYRSLRLSDLQSGERLGIYGFGASGHICLQVAQHWGCDVYVFTRGEAHKRHAQDLGAVWVGEAQDEPPQSLDRSIIFAPAGWIVPLALGHLRKAGTLCINAIHMSDIPQMPYHLLWNERTIRTVANATRRDAEAFMPLAAEIPVHTDTEIFDLDAANHALQKMKRSDINGAAVLKIR